MTHRQIACRFSKRHLLHLLNELKSETSSYSKFPGAVRYHFRGSDSEVVDSVKGFSIAADKFIVHGKNERSYRFTSNGEALSVPGNSQPLVFSPSLIDLLLRRSLIDFASDGTAIPLRISL